MTKTLLATALVLATGLALAQGPGYGPGYGYGPGMGRGGGPGMMGGYGQGGMMGGYGPGGGMMGGFGGPLASLDLTDEQVEKVAGIREEMRRKNWDTMGKLQAEQFKLNRLYRSDSVDGKVLGEQQKKVDELRREMLVSHVDVRKQVEAVLTPEQRKQLRARGPWWAREGDE